MIGYRVAESGNVESHEQYLKRLTGLIRLYAAIVISKSRRSQSSTPNPYNLENGWIWLTNMLNLDPLPDVSATLIHEFLTNAGSEMWSQYGKQFIKLLIILHQNYMEKLNKVTK